MSKYLPFTLSFFIFFFISQQKGNAQIIDSVEFGNQNYRSSYLYGPWTVAPGTNYRYSRFAYLYEAAELTPMPRGAEIIAIGWKNQSGSHSGSNNLMVYMDNSTQLNLSSMIWGQFIGNSTLVYGVGRNIGGVNNDFEMLYLNNPFIYNGASLVISTENAVAGTPSAPVNYWYDNDTISTKGLYSYSSSKLADTATLFQNTRRPVLKIIYRIPVRDAGVSDLVAPVGVCASTVATPLKVRVKNYGVQRIDRLRIDWMLNGVLQNPVFLNDPLDGAGSVNDNRVVTLDSIALNKNIYQIKAWTSEPNDGLDTLNQNDTLETVFRASLSGDYTINPNAAKSSTNYQNFADFIDDLEEWGVCGPVRANVFSGATFNERLTFKYIKGVSAVNTIRINGNGATVQFNNSTSALSLLTFDSAQHIVIDSLIFKSLNSNYGWGAWITNQSNKDSIIRCVFDMSSINVGVSQNANGIVFSATEGNISTGEENGSDIYIGYNKVIGYSGNSGIYTAFAMSGRNGFSYNHNNIIEHNEFTGFSTYGAYIYYVGKENIFRNNDINRKDKNTTSGFNGIYCVAAGEGTQIIGNRIHTPYNSSGVHNGGAGTAMSLSNLQGTVQKPILVYNNAVYNLNGFITYGLYVSGCQYLRLYHNTFLFDRSIQASGLQYGFFSANPGANNHFRNNSIVMTGGSNGDKYGVYYQSAPTGSVVNNNIYVRSSQSGSNFYAYLNLAFPSQQAIQAVYPDFESGSPSYNPMFRNPQAGDVTPQNPLIRVARLADVTQDIGHKNRLLFTATGAEEITAGGNHNAGAIAVIGPDTAFCPANKPLKAVIYNGGLNNINSLKINWSVNGVTQTPINYNNTLVTMSATSGKNIDTITLGNVFISSIPGTTVKVWTSEPNNNTDPIATNDTVVTTFRSSMSGTYTVDSAQATAGTNFQSFSDLTAALNEGGVCGPVTINVAANTSYSEMLEFGNIKGVSAINKIRINGNGARLNYLPTQSAPHLLVLSGTKYLTIDSLHFQAKASNEGGWGALFTAGAAYDSLIRCHFDLTKVVGNIGTSNGITISGSRVSAVAQGNNASDIYVGHCSVKGNPTAVSVQYGVSIVGGNVANQNNNIVFEYNKIQDFHTYGAYIYYANNVKFNHNEITRSNKTTLPIFYGIYMGGLNGGTEIVGNRIHTPGGAGGTSSTQTGYGIYGVTLNGIPNNPILIANNALYNLNQMIVAGIYLSGPRDVHVYHNTISFDRPVSSNVEQYGIWANLSNAENHFRNNIVSFTGGGTGTKNGFYYSTADYGSFQMNNIYMNSSQSGTQNYGGAPQKYTTAAAFRAAYPNVDQGAPAVNPQFLNAASGNLAPQNPALIGSGVDLNLEVPLDIYGYPRSIPPTIGAFREGPNGVNNAGVLVLTNPDRFTCSGTQPVKAVIYNAGTNNITNLRINWSLNSVNQTPVNYTNTLVPMGASGRTFDTITLGNINLPSTSIILKAWTSQPNGLADTVNYNDTIIGAYKGAMGGNYTINKSAFPSNTNYQSFSSFVNALMQNGVCAPVTVNVVSGSGPYTEYVHFGPIAGVSATNTIKVIGNGETVQYNTASGNLQLLVLDRTSYVTIDNVKFKSLSTSNSGWGALITNGSHHDSIIRCTFDLSIVASSSSVNSNGIVFSASSANATTAGENGSDIYIGYNRIIGSNSMGGPYYGIMLSGTRGQNNNNVIEYNEISNFTATGALLNNPGNIKFRYNDIHRATKGYKLNFTGIQATGLGAGSEINGNRIHDSYNSATVTNPTVNYMATGMRIDNSYGEYGNPVVVSNNAVYNINLDLQYGLNANNNSYAYFYHNTIAHNLTHTAASKNYGMWFNNNATSEVKNNIVSITGGGTGHLYGIYYQGASAVNDAQMNSVYMNSQQPGKHYYAFRGKGYEHLESFRIDNPGWELNSIDVDPDFVDVQDGDVTPKNLYLRGLRGEPIHRNVPFDMNDDSRDLRPMVGAVEVPANGQNNAAAMAFVNPKGIYCSDTQTVKFLVSNAGLNNLNSFQVHWTLNGVTQTPINYTGNLTPYTTTLGIHFDTIVLGKVFFPETSNTVIKAWTSNPNGQLDADRTNDTLTETFSIIPFTPVPLMDTLCPDGNVLIHLQPEYGYIADLVWQYSLDGNNWTDIPNSNVTTYTENKLPQSKWYRVKLNNANTCYSDSVRIQTVDLDVASAMDSSRCGPGEVVLQATTSMGGTVYWYDSPTSANALGVGSTFTTPFLNQTDTFWAVVSNPAVSSQAWVGDGIINGNGGYNPLYTSYQAHKVQHLVLASELYDAGLLPGKIKSLSLEIAMVNSAGAFPDFSIKMGATTEDELQGSFVSNMHTVYETSSISFSPSTHNFQFDTPYEWDGVSNLVVEFCKNGTSAAGGSIAVVSAMTDFNTSHYAIGNYTTDFCDNPPNLGGFLPYRPNMWFNIRNDCESDRKPVIAKINPAVPDIDLGNDTVLCTNSFALTLDAKIVGRGITYLWNNAATGKSIIIDTAGLYAVKVTDSNGCYAVDTIEIKTDPVVLGSLPDSINLCQGDFYTLDAGNTGATYLWSTGATTKQIVVNSGGIYTVRITSPLGCIEYDTVVVNAIALPLVNLGNDTLFCSSGFNLPLDAENAIPGVSYQWSTNATTRIINVTSPGKYFVTVTNSYGCVNADTINVSLDSVALGSLPDSINLCQGDFYTLDAGNIGATYLWSTGATTKQIVVNSGGNYSVRITSPLGCAAYDTVKVISRALPVVTLRNDTIMCAHDSVLLHAGNTTGISFAWNTGGNDSVLWAENAGKFVVEVTDVYGCKGKDSVMITAAPMPVKTLPSSDGFCLGNSVSLDAGNFGSSYLWNTGATSRTITTNTTGYHWVKIKNLIGCYVIDSVYIAPFPMPGNVDLGVDTGFCPGGFVTLRTGNNDTLRTVLWSNNSTADTLNVTNPGTYSVVITNQFGCSASDTVSVAAFSNPPAFDLGNDTTFCHGLAYILRVGNTDSTSSVLWSDNSTEDTLVVAASGIYWARLTNRNGCSVSDSVEINLYSKPAGVELGNDTAICANNVLVLSTNNTDPNTNFLWSDNSTGRTLTVTASGQYFVTVTAPGGCFDSDTINVSLNPIPSAFDLGRDTGFCIGNSIMLHSGNANPLASVLWSDNSTGNDMLANSTGLHFATITNEYGCSVSDSIYLDVWSLPFVDLGKDTSLCSGDSLVLRVPATVSDFVRWQDGSNGSVFNANKNGQYHVFVRNSHGCENRDTINITFRPLPHTTGVVANAQGNNAYQFLAQNVTGGNDYFWSFGDGYISNAATPVHTYSASGTYRVSLKLSNDCGDFWSYVTVEHHATGIDAPTIDNAVVKVYPNPAKDFVRIENLSAFNMETLVLYNMLGQEVFKKQLNQDKNFEMDIRGLASGVYQIKIVFADGQWMYKKFEVSR